MPFLTKYAELWQSVSTLLLSGHVAKHYFGLSSFHIHDTSLYFDTNIQGDELKAVHVFLVQMIAYLLKTSFAWDVLSEDTFLEWSVRKWPEHLTVMC